MMSTFNIEEARKSGKSDEQIAGYLLTKFPKFNSEKARASGKTDTEIAEYLSQFPVETFIRTEGPPPTPPWGKENPNLYKGFQIGKDVYKNVGKPTLEVGGLVGGAAIGTAGGPLGQVAMAGAGYATAKQLDEIISGFLDDIQYKGLITFREKKSVTADMKQAMMNVKEGAMLEMFGQSAGVTAIGVLDKAKAPFQRAMTAENAYYRDLARKNGIQPTPSDVTQSKSLGLFESVMEKSPTASDYIAKFRLDEQLKPLTDKANKLIEDGAPVESVTTVGRKIWSDVNDFLQNQTNLKGDALNKMRTEILSRIGTDLSFEAIGITGKELLRAKSIAAYARAKVMYDDVITTSTAYQTPNLSETAKKLLDIKKGLPSQDSKMMSVLKWSAKDKNVPDDVLAQLDTLPPNLRESFLLEYGDEFLTKRDWATLQEFRSDLFNLTTKEDAMYSVGAFGQKGLSTKEAGVYKTLRKALDKDLENIAAAEGGSVWEKFQAANFFYGEEFKGVFGQPVIKKLAASTPEKLVDIAFKPNGVTEIKLLKKALGPDGFNSLKEGFTKKLLGAGKHDVFEPSFLRNNLIKYGDETLAEVYGTSELTALKRVAKEGFDLNKPFPGTQFLKTITKTYPDIVVDSIIGSPESKLQSHTLVKNLSMIKAAVGKEYIKEQLGPKLLEKIFAKESVTNMIKPVTVSKAVDKYGDRVLKILFEPEKVKEIHNIANIGRRFATAERIAGNPSGTGQTIIGWGTLGMIFRNPVKGTLLAVTPKMMSKIYLSKFGLKYFTDGFKTSPTTAKGIELATKISAILGTQEDQ